MEDENRVKAYRRDLKTSQQRREVRREGDQLTRSIFVYVTRRKVNMRLIGP